MRQTRMKLTTKARDDEGPSPVDLHVGLRLRARRKALGMSQTALAEAAGVTFQQLQKYERAANRVSASRLYLLGQHLGVEPGYFFEGLDGMPTGPSVPPALVASWLWLASFEAQQFAQRLTSVGSSLQRMVLNTADSAIAIAMMAEGPAADTPASVAAKAKTARAVADLARGIQ